MTTRAILPVKISLTDGDFYTLWAPTWKEKGTQWQAFLGDDENVLGFESPAEMLVYLEENSQHDLSDHPQWESFNSGEDDRVVPEEKHHYDIIGAPAYLAGRPSHENVSNISRVFQVTKSLGEVASADETTIFFASHSILKNVERGYEHYAGANGLEEWSGVGRAVLTNWKKVVEALDKAVRIVETDSKSSKKVDAAEEKIAAAAKAREKRDADRERAAQEEKDAADPYDLSVWGEAGIDPVKISAQGKSVYTLRSYLGGAPVFLGKHGEIFTFPTAKHLVRWLVEHDDHDLARASTWEDIMVLANAGELEVDVHEDNSYSFNGIAEDIRKGVDAVDTKQMGKAYEVLADAADWAGDDSLNSFLLANPRMQDYLAYMLGSTESAGYVPSAPFNDKADAWTELETMLTKRFSKF